MHLCPKIFSTFSYWCNCCRGNKGSSRIKPETTHSMIKMAAPCVNSPRSQTLLNSLIVKSCSYKICGHTWFPLYTLYPQAKIGNFRKTPPEQNQILDKTYQIVTVSHNHDPQSLLTTSYHCCTAIN
mgnify:CR=1 FL=1